MSNRTTLDDLQNMTVEQASAIAAEELAMLADDIAAMERRAKTARAFLNMAVQAKYPQIAAMGTTRIPADGVDVVVNIPRTVKWDNVKLAEIEQENDAAGHPLWAHMDIKRTVADAVYKRLDDTTRKLFDDARTVTPGSPSVKFERRAA